VIEMNTENRLRRSTVRWSTVIRIVGVLVAPLWVGPALNYNLAWGVDGMAWENVVATILVLAGAASFAALHFVQDWSSRLLAIALGIGLIFNNSWNALETIASAADHRIDGRKAEIVRFNAQWSARSGWSTSVDAAKAIVGDKSVGALEGELQLYLSQNARKWQATRECDPMEITRSRDFCAEVARLRSLIETAKDRDEKAGWIREHDAANKDTVAPTNVDPMATTVSSMLATFGVTPTAAGLEGIRHWRSFNKTVVLEAMAAVLPFLWMKIIEGLVVIVRAAQRLNASIATRRAGRRQREVHDVADHEAQAGEQPKPKTLIFTPEFERFCADGLETGDPTWVFQATPAYQHWRAWCHTHGAKPCSQKRFGQMMRNRFTKDRNNGYPRYLGVRAKPKAPNLRVVINAG
jgi:hypothetical protein